MKYVKIFDSQMRPLGVLQLGAELAQSEETKYVKVYDENLDKCNGVVALSDNISEADAAKRIKIYDANLILIGGSTVGEISDERVTPDLTLLDVDPIRYGGAATVSVYTPEDLTGNMELYIDNQTQPYQTVQVEDARADFVVRNLSIGNHPFHVHYVGDENYRPADVYGTITVTAE